MNILTTEKRVAVISALVEGCSIRSTVRLTGVAKDTILKLRGTVGEACLECQDAALRDLPCTRLECDEIWCFCYCKDKNVPADRRGEPSVGSMWTWTALDADSKLMVSWRLGALARGGHACPFGLFVPSQRQKPRTKFFAASQRPKPCASVDLLLARSTQPRAETEFCRVFTHRRQKPDCLRFPSFVPFGPLSPSGRDKTLRLGTAL